MKNANPRKDAEAVKHVTYDGAMLMRLTMARWGAITRCLLADCVPNRKLKACEMCSATLKAGDKGYCKENEADELRDEGGSK